MAQAVRRRGRSRNASHPPAVSQQAVETSGQIRYLEFFRAGPVERIRIIKAGILASDAKSIFSGIGSSQSEAMQVLAVSLATLNRKAKSQERLAPAESERVLGVARLVGQVQAMVEESGDHEGFDASAWLSRWLREPLPALNGVRPRDLLDTIEGQNLVASMLARIESGAYA